MKYSVIIPVYNSAYILKTCIYSIMNQTFKDFEAIFVNDGSTDGSELLLDQEAKRYNNMKVIHQENHGISYTRNVGLESAIGDYILFVDGDDAIDLGLLESVNKYIDRYHDDITIFRCNVISSNKFHGVDTNINERDNSKLISGNVCLACEPLMVFNKVFKKKLLDDNNIRFVIDVNYEDLVFSCYAIAHAKSIRVVEEKLYYYIQHNESFMKSPNIERINSITKTLENIRKYYANAGLFNCYRDEIEWLTIQHVLYYSNLRLITYGNNPKDFPEKFTYVETHYPDFRRNKYIYSNNISDINNFFLKRILENKFSLLIARYYYFVRLKLFMKTFLRIGGKK